MKIAGLIATCSTMLLCSMLITSYFEIESTDKITTAIEEKPSVSQTYNHYETNNYYKDDDTEKIKELEEKINELETEDDSNEEVLVGVNQYGVVVNTQPQEIKEPWRGPKNYKCDKMAGYPAICGYCGEQGEIHYNIQEWMDNNGTFHLTHRGCGKLYCDKNNVSPRIEESYKIN